ncbi:endonuclease [Nocardiopsis gilva YIM 90087]|uniref:Endonuclease n=1 Tax=Nocardiopsis gilva YIM 90087 TaxID=1235441 RepID=A0A223S7Z7_9ACTN|nr:endonuclease [Nocardiopsis gilva]ASU84202.1 endonuclease [Nocardiopsis gilva YIM 90087]
MTTPTDIARAVVREAGQTLAERAGIRMADRPEPLWQLLVLVNLLSARISADIAIAAARELYAAGGATPAGMAELDWQDRVDALGRGRYVRYDESTATRLGECARIVLDEYNGDLRRLADEAGGDRRPLSTALRRFPGIGPTGATMFCREAQAVWAWLCPFADDLSLRGAERVGLPASEPELGGLVPKQDTAALAAGLVSIARDADLAERVRGGAG